VPGARHAPGRRTVTDGKVGTNSTACISEGSGGEGWTGESQDDTGIQGRGIDSGLSPFPAQYVRGGFEGV